MNNRQRNKFIDTGFKYVGIFSTSIGLVLLAVFIVYIAVVGLPRINWDFIVSLPSRLPARAGILTAWTGTLWILVLTSIISIPLGVAAGLYLEEYGKKNRLSRLIEINIANLAGVPSIIYGILGLEIFVRIMNFGNTILAGAFTLSLLILPIIIVATREAIKSVPHTLREASYGLGATKWQTIWYQVLPAASNSILTGVILALSRAIGETAPLIVIGAVGYVPFVAAHPLEEFTVLPMQIFNWVSRPQHGFMVNAAAAILALLFFVFAMNGLAVYLRNKAQKRMKW